MEQTEVTGINGSLEEIYNFGGLDFDGLTSKLENVYQKTGAA